MKGQRSSVRGGVRERERERDIDALGLSIGGLVSKTTCSPASETTHHRYMVSIGYRYHLVPSGTRTLGSRLSSVDHRLKKRLHSCFHSRGFLAHRFHGLNFGPNRAPLLRSSPGQPNSFNGRTEGLLINITLLPKWCSISIWCVCYQSTVSTFF